jgi:hypothetical protein
MIPYYVTSVAEVKKLAASSRLLPLGIVASGLCVSKQRLSDLIKDGRILTEALSGARLVVVSSALKFATARCLRMSRGKETRLRR